MATLATVISGSAYVPDQPTDLINNDIALQPGDNPYAYLDENGEFVIDITEDNPRINAEGIHIDTPATQAALFYVTYDGNATAEAWIEHEGVGVTFVVDGEPVESPERAARLTTENDAVPVGVEIDTRVAEIAPCNRLIDDISAHARVVDPEKPTDGDDPAEDPGHDGEEDDDRA